MGETKGPSGTQLGVWLMTKYRNIGVIQTMVGELVTKKEHERTACQPTCLHEQR